VSSPFLENDMKRDKNDLDLIRALCDPDQATLTTDEIAVSLGGEHQSSSPSSEVVGTKAPKMVSYSFHKRGCNDQKGRPVRTGPLLAWVI